MKLMNKEKYDIIRDKLAEQVHIQWSGWMEYLFKQGNFNDDGTWTMNRWAVSRWSRQKDTPYGELTESEKMSDINEADKFLSFRWHTMIEAMTDNEKK